MSEFTRASQERIHAFPIDEQFLFKHYFEQAEVFEYLKRFYNGSEYRFEVPAEQYPDVTEFLGDYGYGLVTVEDVAEFVVVVEKYTAHPDNVFEESVYHGSEPGYIVFLMKDRAAAERAVNNGATPLRDTDLSVPF
jgi:hypothetical protein